MPNGVAFIAGAGATVGAIVLWRSRLTTLFLRWLFSRGDR